VTAPISLEPARGEFLRSGGAVGEEHARYSATITLPASCKAVWPSRAIKVGPIIVYLSEFQMSVASFQSLPTFCHTTTYLPVSC
jgi:hypothetical protein